MASAAMSSDRETGREWWEEKEPAGKQEDWYLESIECSAFWEALEVIAGINDG